MKTRAILAVAALIGGLILAACAAPTSPAPAGDSAPPPVANPDRGLEGSSWTLTDLNGAPPAASGAPTLQFDVAGSAGGTTGCNQYTGGFTVDAAALSFGQLASTKMACAPELMQQEQQYLDILGRATGYTLAGATLTITADGGETLVYSQG